jgi:hypothetical protein
MIGTHFAFSQTTWPLDRRPWNHRHLEYEVVTEELRLVTLT